MIIDNKFYKVNDNEYSKLIHTEFTNLRLYNELTNHERIIGFIQKLKQLSFTKNTLLSVKTTHGGFIPINISKNFDDIYFLDTDKNHAENIETNIVKYNIKNIFEDTNNLTNVSQDELTVILNLNNCDIQKYNSSNNTIVISYDFDKNINYNDVNFLCYKFKNIELYVYVSHNLVNNFELIFKYFIEEKQNITDLYDKIITYDNLINLCIMVKNAGPQFRNMLNDNLNIIDKWTILDTGSTDETISIIEDVLVGKKEGNLYQEPFINFRDSRNRLLDLAGNDCKYILTLDDTYIIKGDLRYFLNEIRSDQYSTSFTLFINSDDVKYGSNRIIKHNLGLRYIHKIHEVITDKNNVNVVIPENRAYIFDGRFDYMEKRTHERKQLDLKLLYEEVEENPADPRAYYYLAQTYNLLEDYEKSFYYFTKRAEFTNSGFLQERVDALFESARIANFKLNKPWQECEELYNKCYKVDESRPESLYFIGVHYYLENNFTKAFGYFKKAFEIGFPQHCQYSLKPTLSFHFLPKFLCKICYELDEYEIGKQAAELFLKNNSPTADSYEEVVSWYKIYEKLTVNVENCSPKIPDKPIFVFHADGGFNKWSGSSIVTIGVGGSETYIIEQARHIQKTDLFNVYVFCNCEKEENFEGVIYKPLNDYYSFIKQNYIHTCIVSRFSEYLPATFKGWTENVYFVIHDLTPSGIVIPKDKKLKKIFCLTEWHVEYFTQFFPSLKNITVPFYYGIDFKKFKTENIVLKQQYKFIYSSFPNRGLLQLLQMWPKIYEFQPIASLHIYCDIDGKWVNDVQSEMMNQIRQLMIDYNVKENGMNIYYYGWVNKQVLAQSWLTADIWFYPCTFMETFCLTALEAALTKTLVITNNLAALQNTVDDRGVVIKGDPMDTEWQEKALVKIKKYLHPENKTLKNELIERNFEWASNLSWASQAKKLLDQYILQEKLEYKGMYNWTNDLPVGSMKIFREILCKFVSSYWKIQFQKQINVLEIGSYSGMSLIEIIRCIPNSVGISLDLWSSYDENNLLTNMDNLKVKDSFYKNIKTAGLENRIKGIQLDSKIGLIQFIKDETKFDLIYVDGSHLLLDVYTDIVLSWQILEKGGYLIIDDYLYKKDEVLKSPFEAVNHFLKLYKGQYNILSIDYRVFLEKI